MVLHSWVPCRASVLRFSADEDLTRQINLRGKKRPEQKKTVLPNVYTRRVPRLITDTHRKYTSRDNVAICLPEHTHKHAHTQEKIAPMLMWHVSLPRGCGWDYACVFARVEVVRQELHYRLTAQREATVAQSGSPGPERHAGSSAWGETHPVWTHILNRGHVTQTWKHKSENK